MKSEQTLFFVVALGVEHRDLHSDKARVDNRLEVCSNGLFYTPLPKKSVDSFIFYIQLGQHSFYCYLIYIFFIFFSI
jgi:hypothetical protein